MKNKSAPLALFLSFVPGLGHLYVQRFGRAFLYAAGFFGPVMLIAMSIFMRGHLDNSSVKLLLLIAFFSGAANMVDMIIYLLTARPDASLAIARPTAGTSPEADEAASQQERFFTILLSFIPGLGHLQLGLMQRGIVFLAGFFGAATMILFVSFLAGSGHFIVFLGILPVIWIYGLFDAIQLVHRKQRGETLVDRSVFDDFQEGREEGRKSKLLATLLAVFPGAGHMYLGLQRRGLQFMASFLFVVYVLDALHLSVFLFLIPIIWFYSFFDALQHMSRQDLQGADVPLADWLVNRPRWLGIGLLVIGAYYLVDHVLLRMVDRFFPDIQLSVWFHSYFQTIAVSFLLIAGGLRLLAGSRNNQSGSKGGAARDDA